MEETTEALLRHRLSLYEAEVEGKNPRRIKLSDDQIDYFIELFWWAVRRELEHGESNISERK